jgi:hypothetical protein
VGGLIHSFSPFFRAKEFVIVLMLKMKEKAVFDC